MARSVSSGDGLEVLQHFSEEGSAALDLVIEEFERQSDIAIENTGTHISQLRLHVKNRILQGNPPDVWVEWPGTNLEPTIEAGVVRDITPLWEESGMVDAYADEAKQNARFDGHYRCVPIDIYRINNVFYNIPLCERAGVDPTQPASPEEFLDVLARLDSALDVPAFMLFGRDPFGACQFWEMLVAAHDGPRVYNALLDGNARANRLTIQAALETLDASLEYTPEETDFLTAEDADREFAEGQAAITINGMWSLGRIAATEGFEYGTDWGHVPMPGTDNCFILNMNSLVPSATSDADEIVTEFLRFAGSPDGLEIFDAEVGGIPPREDVSVSSFHPLIQEQKRALERANTQLSSATHGLGISPAQLVSFKSAIASFMLDRDIEATTEALVDTFE